MSGIKRLVVAAVGIVLVGSSSVPGWTDDHVPGELVVRFSSDPEIAPSGGGYTTASAELNGLPHGAAS